MEDVDALVGGEVSPAVLEAFGFEGIEVRTEPLGGGHIHRNFLVTCSCGRYVLQQHERRVFPDVDVVLSNVQRVVAHLQGSGRRCPELVETQGGGLSFRAADASRWRAFRYLEGTVGRSTPAGPADAFEAARAFGDYLVALVDFPGPPLAQTIERFHDLDHRLRHARSRSRCRPGRASIRGLPPSSTGPDGSAGTSWRRSVPAADVHLCGSSTTTPSCPMCASTPRPVEPPA